MNRGYIVVMFVVLCTLGSACKTSPSEKKSLEPGPANEDNSSVEKPLKNASPSTSSVQKEQAPAEPTESPVPALSPETRGQLLDLLVDLACAKRQARKDPSELRRTVERHGFTMDTYVALARTHGSDVSFSAELTERTTACLRELEAGKSSKGKSISRVEAGAEKTSSTSGLAGSDASKTAHQQVHEVVPFSAVSRRFIGQLRAGAEGDLRFRLNGARLTQGQATINGSRIALRNAEVSTDGTYRLAGSNTRDHIQFFGKIRRGGKWTSGTFKGTVGRKKVNGSFSAVAR